MNDYLPKAEHRMCARHIYANWRKKHMAHEWQKKFWVVAKAANSKISIITKPSLHKKHQRVQKIS